MVTPLPSAKTVQRCAVGLAGLVWTLFPGAAALNETHSHSNESGVRTMHDDSSKPEVVITIGEPVDPFVAHSYEFIQNTYDARNKGTCLYRSGQYAESFPYLLAAARRGFKFAQARVSFLYQQGLGTDRDTDAAVGWLSVAAFGETHPEISSKFRQIWQRIPDKHRPHFERVVEEYRSKYEARLHRVACDLSRKAGSYLPMLTCRYFDELLHLDIEMIVAQRPERFFPADPKRSGC